MKKTLTVLVVLGLGAALGRMFEALPRKAEAQRDNPLPPCQDINGDGRSDISDAVVFLNWLFLGGPEPACPATNGQPVGLPATGQTKCYDNRGAEIACDSADFPGQDGFYQAGCPSEGRFVDNGDGTVTDTCTGLMWQKETAADPVNWQGALKYCESLDLAGHSDWRLPNVRELQSLVDYGRFNPSIDPVFEAVSGWYWSSSSDVSRPGYAWSVYLYIGLVYQFDVDKAYRYDVRAVRLGP